MTYAPIIVFAFNRLDVLKNTISSLSANPEAKDSDLFVFVDGARPQKEGEEEKVRNVQDYVKSITGFRQLTYTLSEANKGLAKSIIEGTTEIINKYGKAIVVEDDLIVNPNFLCYMNRALSYYSDEKTVFSICGYTNRVRRPAGYIADTYFCARSSSWGWATWADRWNSVNWELNDWDSFSQYAHAFNQWGGSDCWHMLNDWHKGRNKSWAIRFCFAQFLQNKVSLFPMKSLVRNEGFDGQGTNCKKWSRFKYELEDTDKKNFTWPTSLDINKALYRQAMQYHSIHQRIWSKIMYLIHA